MTRLLMMFGVLPNVARNDSYHPVFSDFRRKLHALLERPPVVPRIRSFDL